MWEFSPIAMVWLLAGLAPAPAQQFGKSENLAPYIPTPQVIVDKMLQAARVKPGQTVYDLGSGDGRIVITAAQKYGAHAVGVELSPDLCRSATARVKALGLADKVRIINDNLLNVDLSPADVVTIYLLTSSNDRLKPNLEKYLKPGARVVSNDFEIRGWNPADVIKVSAGGSNHTIYVYDIGKRK
jgi:16S rRNA A1518/A1519 N6-dimethyltransferase RsmA/KsgA/DIM1 with predicted DNA glycosylase/AP lyase activity